MPQPGPHIPAQLFDIDEPDSIFGITRYVALWRSLSRTRGDWFEPRHSGFASMAGPSDSPPGFARVTLDSLSNKPNTQCAYALTSPTVRQGVRDPLSRRPRRYSGSVLLPLDRTQEMAERFPSLVIAFAETRLLESG